jgi:hypothetical protein
MFESDYRQTILFAKTHALEVFLFHKVYQQLIQNMDYYVSP